jgi:hypothetical protein
MKKKEYSKPEMQVIELHQQLLLQVTSPLPFTIYDDDDNELAHARITEWATYESDDFDEEVQSLLTSLLAELKSQGAFDQLHIMKPYSFVQVDEHKETIAELLLMDDDTLLVNDELLKGLDDELNAFLKDLLEM